jgi:uncharacterized protein (DUF1015 family)
MANIYPFRGLRYSLQRIPVAQVVTQPYDKISKEMQEHYYAQHPNNIIRIVLGKSMADDSVENNVYTRAAAHLNEWRHSGVLEQLPAPAFFVYFQRFTIPGTNDVRVRKGFVGLARLEDYANKIVFPHERTLTGPKKDRLELLRHTRTHFEQIFMLYEDPARRIDSVLDEVSSGKPDIDVNDEYGVTHTVWTVTDPKILTFIQNQMVDKKLLIADGHHRYETALAYRDEMRARHGVRPDAPYERMTMTFFNMDCPGLTILPTHRVLSGVAGFESKAFVERAKEFFDVFPASENNEIFRSELKRAGENKVAIGATVRGGGNYLLTLKSSLDLQQVMPDLTAGQRLLDVVVLHRLLIERCLGIGEEAVKKESHISYVREFDKALKAVNTGTGQVAFLLNGTRLGQMRDIAYEGHVMPQKSTDFYPKVLSGLIMYTLDE